MTTYGRVKSATAGPLRTENAMFILFCLRKCKKAIMSQLQWYLRNNSIFPLYILFFLVQFLMSIDSLVNSSLSSLIVIAPDNDLLMDGLNVIYFTPKWWLYVMIWLPRTTDNSTYFAQSLGIRGIESRLYFVL